MLKAADKIIGREAELASLRAFISESNQGKAGLISISGRSGYGKTFLIDTLKTQVSIEHKLVLYGIASNASAQKPFNILSNVTNQIKEYLEVNPEFHSHVIASVPQSQRELLALLFPNLKEALRITSASPVLDNPNGSRANIEALYTFFQALGRPQAPSVVILDDFQWADELTILFIEFWAKSIAKVDSGNNYTNIIIAYRNDEVSDNIVALTKFTDKNVTLKNLDLENIKKVIEGVLTPVSSETARTIHRISKGSPFIAESLIRSFIESGTIKQMDGMWNLEGNHAVGTAGENEDIEYLKRRFTILGDSSFHFLKAAAIMGKSFNSNIIADVCKLNSHEVKVIIADSEQRHLIQQVAESKYAFTHDKLREIMLTFANELELKEIHLNIAKCLEAAHQESIFELAYHFSEAGVGKNALPYVLKAAREAHDRYALDTAEKQYRIALTYVDLIDSDSVKVISERLGDILMMRGSYEEARNFYLRTKEFLIDVLEKARIEKKLGELAFKQGDITGCMAYLKNGLRMLGEPVPKTRTGLFFSLVKSGLIQALHIVFPRFFLHHKRVSPSEKEEIIQHFYVRLAYAGYFTSDVMELFDPHLKGLNRGEIYLPSKVLSQTWACHAMGLALLPLFKIAFIYSHRAFRIQDLLKDSWTKAQALNMYGLTLYCYGDNSRCISACTEAKKIFEIAGDRWEANIGNCNIAYAIYRLGNLSEASKLAKDSFLDAYEMKDLISAASCIAVWAKASSGAIPHELAKKQLDEDCQLESQPAAELCKALAIYYLSHNQHEEALKYAERAMNIARSSLVISEYTLSSMPWYLTVYRCTLGDFPNKVKIPRKIWSIAKKTLRKARLFKNNLPHTLREVGLFHAMEGSTNKALKYINQSVEAAKHQQAQFEYAQSLLCSAVLRQRMEIPGWESDMTLAKEILEQCKADLVFQRIHGANFLKLQFFN